VFHSGNTKPVPVHEDTHTHTHTHTHTNRHKWRSTVFLFFTRPKKAHARHANIRCKHLANVRDAIRVAERPEKERTVANRGNFRSFLE